MAFQVLLRQKIQTLLDQEVTYLNTLDLCLFINNYTPVAGTTEADLTEPSGGTGYARQSVAFTSSVLDGDKAELIGTTQTFTFTSAGGGFTIYGCFLLDPADGKAVIAQRFTSPFAITTDGQSFSVTPLKEMATMVA